MVSALDKRIVFNRHNEWKGRARVAYKIALVITMISSAAGIAGAGLFLTSEHPLEGLSLLGYACAATLIAKTITHMADRWMGEKPLP